MHHDKSTTWIITHKQERVEEKKKNIAEEGIQRRLEREGNNIMFSALIPVKGIKNIHLTHALFAWTRQQRRRKEDTWFDERKVHLERLLHQEESSNQEYKEPSSTTDLISNQTLDCITCISSLLSILLFSVFFAFSSSFEFKTKKQPEINNWKGKIEHDDGEWRRREIGIHLSSIICYTKRRADNIDHHSKSSLLRLLKSHFDFHSLFMPRSFWIISL